MRATSLGVLLMGCGAATVAHAQSRVAGGVGLHVASVGNSSPVLAATADIGVSLRSQPRQLFLRAQWWATSQVRAGVGLYYGGRWTRHRFVYGEAGVGATGSKDSANNMTVRPAIGFALGWAIDVSHTVQVRLVSGYLRDTQKATYSLGVSLCSCPGS